MEIWRVSITFVPNIAFYIANEKKKFTVYFVACAIFYFLRGGKKYAKTILGFNSFILIISGSVSHLLKHRISVNPTLNCMQTSTR
jgi:hypothetical protein